MNFEVATHPGRPDRANEDWVGSTNGVAVVLDGVSAPGGTRCSHGVAWYARHLGQGLLAMAQDRDHTLTYALRTAIGQVAALHPECDLRYRGTPAAAVGIVRRRGRYIDWLVLADITVVIRSRDAVQVISDMRVDAALDPMLRDAALAAPLGSSGQQQAVMQMSIDQLNRRNVASGYWVAAATPNAADQALVGQTELSALIDVAVVSDGVSRLVSVYKTTTWSGMLEQLRNEGSEHLIDALRTIEDTDPHGHRWPRFKERDDASVAYGRCDTPNGEVAGYEGVRGEAL